MVDVELRQWLSVAVLGPVQRRRDGLGHWVRAIVQDMVAFVAGRI